MFTKAYKTDFNSPNESKNCDENFWYFLRKDKKSLWDELAKAEGLFSLELTLH
jgi:hypothetical protein